MARLSLWTTLVVLLAACKGEAPRGADVVAPTATATAPTVAPEPPGRPGEDRPQTGLEKGVVVFEGSRGEVAVEVEVAQTDEQRRIGMMLRRHCPDGQGMLFLMPDEREHAFWMKNTLIPLDMIFVTGDLSVAGVVAQAEPLTLSSRSVGKPSRYVVEVPGGFAARAGITAGARVRIEGVPGVP